MIMKIMNYVIEQLHYHAVNNPKYILEMKNGFTFVWYSIEEKTS